MSKVTKVDLSLLKQLVGELESFLATADGIKSDTETSNNEYVVEMFKAAGLAAGIMQESSMLVMDIQMAVRSSQGPASKGGDPLDKILGVLKGGGFGGTN